MALQLHGDEHLHMRADCVEVDLRAVAADEPRLLQPFHPFPAGRGRQVDPRRQLGLGDAALAAEGGENGDVSVVEAGLRHVSLVQPGGAFVNLDKHLDSPPPLRNA